MLTTTPLVWLAKTVDVDYIKMRGWKEVILQNVYRKEFVAGNLAEHATSGTYLVSVQWRYRHGTFLTLLPRIQESGRARWR